MSSVTHSTDPFRCYVGRTVALPRGEYFVLDAEIQGRELMFRLQAEDGDEVLVTMLEMLELEAA
jgi:hypothetical protein